MKGLEVQGKPLEVVFELFWEAGIPIVRLAHEAYQQDVIRTTPRMLTRLPKANGEAIESYFVYTLVPIHDAAAKVSGVIIYTADETEQRAREAQEELERLKLIFNNTEVVALALYDAQTARLIMGSPSYIALVARAQNLSQDALIVHSWHDLTLVASAESVNTLWNTILESHAPLRLSEVHLKVAQDE